MVIIGYSEQGSSNGKWLFKLQCIHSVEFYVVANNEKDMETQTGKNSSALMLSKKFKMLKNMIQFCSTFCICSCTCREKVLKNIQRADNNGYPWRVAVGCSILYILIHIQGSLSYNNNLLFSK